MGKEHYLLPEAQNITLYNHSGLLSHPLYKYIYRSPMKGGRIITQNKWIRNIHTDLKIPKTGERLNQKLSLIARVGINRKYLCI